MPRLPSRLWIAALALATPALAASSPSAEGGRHALFSEVLAAHVHEGHVDYPAMCGDARLTEYLSQVAATDPSTLETQARLALWINAYNGYTLKLICDNWPVKSINDLATGGRVIGTVLGRTAWDRESVVVNGETMTLNHVEHDIIRKEFEDFRVHFALVCAARSCPPLRSEAFVADRLDAQLDDQGRTFFHDEEKNRFEVDSKTAHVSKILEWFKEDFGDSQAAVLLAVAPYLPEAAAESVRADPSAWSVDYLTYDWALND